MPEPATFSGFPPAGLDFLAGLAEDNSKRYFDAHRETYEEALLEPARDFVVALGAELQSRVSPDIHAEPRVNGSIFRINRDTRFSRDKTPYKTHLDLFFWEGAGRSRECPGFFFRLGPDALLLGAGMHRFDGGLLDAYRNAVAADPSGDALESALARVTQGGGVEIGGKSYKRVPQGFAPGHPRAEFLKHDGLYVWTETALPKVVHEAGLVAWCADRLAALAPLHRWIVDTLR